MPSLLSHVSERFYMLGLGRSHTSFDRARLTEELALWSNEVQAHLLSL